MIITMPGPFGSSSTLPKRRTTSRWYAGTIFSVIMIRMTAMTAMTNVGEIGMGASLFDLRSRRDVFDRCEERGDFLFAGGQDHALRLDAHDLGRLEVRHDDHALTHQVFRRVLGPDSCDDLTLLGANVHLLLEKLGGLRHTFRREDLADAQRDFFEL